MFKIYKQFLIQKEGFSIYIIPYFEISLDYGESFWFECGWLFFRLTLIINKKEI